MDTKGLLQDIDAIREHNKLTVSEMCRQAGVSRKSYLFWLTGKCSPNLAALNAVLEVLQIELIPFVKG